MTQVDTGPRTWEAGLLGSLRDLQEGQLQEVAVRAFCSQILSKQRMTGVQNAEAPNRVVDFSHVRSFDYSCILVPSFIVGQEFV